MALAMSLCVTEASEDEAAVGVSAVMGFPASHWLRSGHADGAQLRSRQGVRPISDAAGKPSATARGRPGTGRARRVRSRCLNKYRPRSRTARLGARSALALKAKRFGARGSVRRSRALPPQRAPGAATRVLGAKMYGGNVSVNCVFVSTMRLPGASADDSL